MKTEQIRSITGRPAVGSIIAAICALAMVGTTSGQTWTNAGAPFDYYVGVACSTDGTTLIGAQDFGSIQISTNSGGSWSEISLGYDVQNYCVACSSDASELFVGAGGSFFISTNLGLTWSTNEAPGSVTQIACAADGSRVAVAYLAVGSYSNILYSSDSGATFASNSVPTLYFSSIVSSADGSKLVGSPSHGALPFSGIYRSGDFGVTWAQTTAPVLGWDSIACSADGTRLAAVTFTGLWLSTNSGLNWMSNSASFESPVVVASSADGTRLIVAGNSSGSNNIYTSLDSGNTWTTNNAPATTWNELAMSPDGSILLASTEGAGGGIYMAHIPAQPSLSITPSGSNLTLFWPLPSAGFVLQESADLTSTNWVNVTNAVAALGYYNQVTVSPPATGNAYYRLAGP
jgi:photosystem II stability/assembly factor-like uncharacterized protein